MTFLPADLLRVVLALTGATPVPAETADLLKVAGPYLATVVTALGTVMGYGALKAIVARLVKDRDEDVKAADVARAAIDADIEDERRSREAQVLATKAELLAAIREVADSVKALATSSTADMNGLGARIGKLDREIGEVKSGLSGRMDEHNHRLDQHAARSASQQAKNAEFFAQEAAGHLKTIEAMLKAREAREGGDAA